MYIILNFKDCNKNDIGEQKIIDWIKELIEDRQPDKQMPLRYMESIKVYDNEDRKKLYKDVYELGGKDGYLKGFNSGEEMGYSTGREEGYLDGCGTIKTGEKYLKGFENGYEKGEYDGYFKGRQAGRRAGFEDGYAKGVSKNF